MKKIIVLIGLFLGILTAHAQWPKPATHDSLKVVYSPSWMYDMRDSNIVMGKGPYLYNRFLNSVTIQKKIDSLGWNLVPYRDGRDSVIIEYPIKAYQFLLDTLYTPDGSETKGSMYWDEVNKTASILLGNNVVGQVFKEVFIDGQNNTGAQIPDGTPVEYAGSIGNSGNFRIRKALVTPTQPTMYFIGIATENIEDGAVGKITTQGKVRGIQTNGANYGETWTDSTIVYPSHTTRGYLTKFPPPAPYPAIPAALVISAHATNGTLEVRPTYPQRFQDSPDVNGTALTTKGQIPVWNQTHKYFDFNYNIWPDLISDEVYSSAWDGVDSIAPSKDAIYDKIHAIEPVSYCPATMTVNRGTLVTGTAADLCEVGGTDVRITELNGTDPLRVTFAFSGVEKMSSFVFYGDYNGGAAHIVWAEIYNYNTTTWDYLGQFTTSPTKAWYTFPIYNSAAYISSGAVEVRISHQGTGVNTHNLYLDYLDINFGGGSGSGGGGGGVIPSTAYANKVEVTANPFTVTWPTDFSNNNYFLNVNAYYEKTINSKVVRIKNAVYDFTKTVSGFSLKVDTLAGYVEYFAADTIMTTAFDNFLTKADSLTQYVTPTQLKDSMNTVAVTETDPTVSAYTKGLTTDGTVITAVKNVDGTGSGLDADLLDGQHGSYYQPTSTAINTGNIGSQSVSYATSAGSVTNSQIIKFNTGTTEGTDLYTYNGSVAKTVDIKPGTNVTFTAAAGSVTINSTGGSGTFSGAKVYASQTAISGTTDTTIPFANEDFDTGTYHDNSTNNSRLTVPSDGYYEVSAYGEIELLSTSGTWLDVIISKNGTAQHYITYQADENFITANALGITIPGIILYCTSGQYIELKMRGNASSVFRTYTTGVNAVYFQIKKL